ncbi:MAG: GAF domain-containing protein [Rhodoglobus sp.]
MLDDGDPMDSDSDSDLRFPDEPRSRLDRVLGDLVDSAKEVLETQGRLRNLLKASRVVADELELAVVLRRIVEAAVELVGARYGAIGVISPEGTLEQFIHVGMPADLVNVIGHLPEGHGVLGALIQEQETIRLEHISEDGRSAGFPAGHPAMESFLGVPVRVRGEVYGNLYLTEQESGRFSAEDEQLLSALAATAGAAIDHARLYDESERRRRWSAASAEITAALLSNDADDSLAILTERVALLADADLVCIAVPLGARKMSIEMARGPIFEEYLGLTFDTADTLAGRAFESRQPILSDIELGDPLGVQRSMGPTMAVPLASSEDPIGVLTVSRLSGRPRFTATDLDMVAEFAAQAGLALRLAAARADAQALALLEDRGRIARDLHDNVIQRLFGAGLSIQAVAGGVADLTQRDRLVEQVEVLEAAIAEIRTAIFAMTAQASSRPASLRHRLIDVLAEASDLFPESPQLVFSGAVDLLVPPALADDVVAVVREGLSNVARHAGAEHTWISVAATPSRLVVTIQDDGVGVNDGGRASGTLNLAERARANGGQFNLAPRNPAGTTLVWSASLAESDAQ